MYVFKRLFGFFYTEFTGALVLLVIAFLFALVPRIYSAQQNASKVYYTLDSVEVAKLMLLQQKKSNHFYKAKLRQNRWEKVRWARSKGYKFKSYKDLSKYSGLPVEELKKGKTTQLFYPKKYTGKIYLNQSDTSKWKGLKGVGSKLAARIVKFRTRLGGFHSIDQLKTVWGLDSTIVISQRGRFMLEPNSWTCININTCTKEELVDHPYIGKYDAVKILTFRLQHPEITRSMFQQIKSIKHDRLYRMLPYLKF